MPYRVQLDGGCEVLVHRDEHWLIRDLALQPAPASRQAPGGVRCLSRIERRQCGDRWEAVDHTTRRVRPCSAPLSDDEDDEDDDDAKDRSQPPSKPPLPAGLWSDTSRCGVVRKRPATVTNE